MNSLTNMAVDGLMGWVSGLAEQNRGRSEASAQRAMSKLGMSFVRIEPGWWFARGPEKHGYSVRLDLICGDRYVHVVASANIVIPREWLPRELALKVLERTPRGDFGQYRFVPSADGLCLVLEQRCDTGLFTAGAMADIGRALTEEMQETVVQLYAQDLIIAREEAYR